MDTSVFKEAGKAPLQPSHNGALTKSLVAWNVPLQQLPYTLAQEVGLTDIETSRETSLLQEKKAHKRLKTLYVGLGILSAIVLVGFFVGAKKESSPPQNPVSERASPAASWQPLIKPVHTFSLSAPEWENIDQTYQVWQHEGLGLIEDRLALGRFSDIGMHAQLAVFRSTSSSRTSDATTFFARTFYLDLVRASAQNGLGMMRLGRIEPTKTKFGTLETADVVLSDGTSERACLAYRHISTDSQLRFNGWMCAAPQHAASREDLECFVDSIRLKTNSGDAALRQAFSHVELKRNPACHRAKTTSSTTKTGVVKRL
jgi:hypothetical protein